MVSWSNPDPSNATSAVLSAPYKFGSASIGNLVDAILTYRRAQERQQQEGISYFSRILTGKLKNQKGGMTALGERYARPL